MKRLIFFLSTLACLAVTTFIVRSGFAQDQKTERLIDERPFLAENTAAMDKMMADMDVKPTGDIDADFTAMMVPHHQGAIDMAVAYLRYGKNEQLRRLAQEIIVEQQQEIAAMKLAIGEPLPPSVPAPTQPGTSAAASVRSSAATAHHEHSTMPHGMTSHGTMSPESPNK